ncbi:hypothetical protein G3601_005096 [Salmonella enterica]|uniref:Uncharacterized protein n=2 Tax=Salmonella enterica TaxID=28901 RepID=A0A619HWR5_SALER|nr:hypothetical protein [Salmonella enterica subsp. enterica serovar Java]EAN9729280.1 hypothetical protein [Salmonella enterica]EBV8394731.1 hypothetical protein [Salmonella enterica subsp. enterica serovar Virchow]EDQ0183610.1 hypothetical protein [Salmonella enterica subsp. enterica serovar 4,[5],12:b:-]EDV9614006.1 hypothetical protein [Salmonella enterica subsp. enterica serovar Paratyphi B]EEE5613234.1 hypothetical protein [Salmonella enterica subsp. enterica serovar Typhimurium]
MTIDEAGLLAVLHDIARTNDTPARNVSTDYADVVASVLQREEHDLNGFDLLTIRTRASAILTARRRHQQRENAAPYQWKKP